MRLLVALLAAALLTAPAGARAGGTPGEFDYYVLALSWNAAWCEDTSASGGAGRGAPQCAPGRDIGFVLHGLWPQYEDGWPEYCQTAARDPSRAETAAMADITGSAGLAWHAWKKHGRCSGLGPERYFALSRAAWESVARPEALRRIRLPQRLSPAAIERAFLDANPGLAPDAVTVTCKARMFNEVRICLTRNNLAPRPCTGPAARECPLDAPLFPPMR